jgi:glycosyltransferase involved in cell wall biosynthesis
MSKNKEIFKDYIKWFFKKRGKEDILFRSEAEHKRRLREMGALIEKEKTPKNFSKKSQGHNTRKLFFEKKQKSIDVSDFSNIIEFNEKEKWISVEPQITFDKLVRFTLSHGLIPNVVPELKNITPGGAIAGLGVESSSHIYGFFHEKKNILNIECILGDGSFVSFDTEDSRFSDLYNGLCGSYGSVALITKIKIRLRNAKPWVFVKKTETPLSSLNEHLRNEFVDGIFLKKNRRCIVGTASFVENPPLGAHVYKNKGKDEWFDMFFEKDSSREFYMKTYDYLFRWDRGAFFTASEEFGSNWLRRVLFGIYASSENLYRIGNKGLLSRRITQDFIIPIKNAESFIDEILSYDNEFIRAWVQPITTEGIGYIAPKAGRYINIGLYHKIKQTSGEKYRLLNKRLENSVTRYEGYKFLYADVYYTSEVFWKIYPKDVYERVRKKYHSEKIFYDIETKLMLEGPTKKNNDKNQTSTGNPLISIILPTRNEKDAILWCIESVKRVLAENNISSEIIVSDSSWDGTDLLAQKRGACVVKHDKEGYGRAYIEGVKHAKGKYLFFADADGTYDFYEIPKFLFYLEQGYDFVIGNRFAGTMEKGAMPFLNKYIGNPVLSWLFQVFFHAGIRDTHSGMRAIKRSVFNDLSLRTTGMEFASEMIIKLARGGYKLLEIPINYHTRIGKTKLKKFSDGWRHLRFMLLYSPFYLFFVPGCVIFSLGVASLFGFYTGRITFFGLPLFFHPMFISALLIIIGYQAIIFSFFAKIYAIVHLNEKDNLIEKLMKHITLERAVVFGFIFISFGIGIFSAVFLGWVKNNFPALDEVKNSIIALILVTLGIQTFFSGFMMSILGIKENDNF